ncbi:hypothetical protein JCM1393_03510 [Clostridium carnis]
MSPKISDEKKEYQKERIRSGAKDVFRKRGYEKTTMKDIREHIGMSAGGLYTYFKSKEEIFLNILALEIKREVNINMVKEKTVLEQFESYIEYIEEYIKKLNYGIEPIIYEYSGASWREPNRSIVLKNRYNNKLNFILDLIDEGVKRGEFNLRLSKESIASFIIITIKGIISSVLSIGNEIIKIDMQIKTLKEFCNFAFGIKEI